MSGGQTAETLVGAGVVAVAAAFAVYALGFAERGEGRGSYPLSASFRSAEGIGIGTDIRLAGVKVGTVTGLALDPETFRARATLGIRDGVVLPDDSSVAVASEGLLGGAYLELLPGGSAFDYAAGDEILDTESAVSIVTLLARFVAAGE